MVAWVNEEGAKDYIEAGVEVSVYVDLDNIKNRRL
jgi:hypothetical protein